MTEDEIGALPAAAQAFIATLQAQIAAFQAQITALEGRLAEPKKDSSNSSVPPSKSYKAKRKADPATTVKRGPKKGHPGTTRALSLEPDLQEETRVATCDRCGEDLRAVTPARIERRQVVELPPVKPVVFEAVRPLVVCPGCGQRHQAAFPPNFRAPSGFGPRVQALVAYLHEIQHVGYERLQRLLASVFGLSIALGSLVNLVQRTGEAAAGPAAAIRQEVVTSPVVASDETGMRVDGDNYWLWVVRTAGASSFAIEDSRGARVLAEIMGEQTPEVWVSDLLSAQQKAPAHRFQICIAHQLRDLEHAYQCGDRKFSAQMQALFRKALHLAKERVALSATDFEAQRQTVEGECDALLTEDVLNPKGRKLQARYRKHRAKLFVFLERVDVPPDNNGSERDLRNAVVHRKVTGGFRSDWAPAAYADLLSVVETAKKRGGDVFTTLLHLLSPMPLSSSPSP